MPIFQQIIVSRDFPTRQEAVDFAKETKAEYKDVVSIKYDVQRTQQGQWNARVFKSITK
jgi:orotidine-5'-phosphate decarboxylase